jgi:hypothetical protein
VIRIGITQAAFEAICATMPFGSAGHEAERTLLGEIYIWLDRRAMDRLTAERRQGEDYSDVIIRLAAVGHESLNGS